MKDFIIPLLEKYEIEFTESAKQELVAKCPFHNDKTPSFSISGETGLWHCFGCEEGGNLQKFVFKLTGQELKLNEILTPGEIWQSTLNTTYQNSLQNILRYENDFQEYYKMEAVNFSSVFDFKPALEYLKNRGFTDETIIHFGLLFAYSGKYAGRIIIPYKQGTEIVGFNSRLLDASKQNASHLRYRYAINENRFYGFIYNYRPVKTVILCEGPFDLMWMNQCGYSNVQSTLNTNFKIKHFQKLAEVKNFIFVFDNDENKSGENAVIRAASVIFGHSQNKRVFMATLPFKKDPNDCTPAELATSLANLKELKPEYHLREMRFDIRERDSAMGIGTVYKSL